MPQAFVVHGDGSPGIVFEGHGPYRTDRRIWAAGNTVADLTAYAAT